jgi:hypothetical protein
LCSSSNWRPKAMRLIETLICKPAAQERAVVLRGASSATADYDGP